MKLTHICIYYHLYVSEYSAQPQMTFTCVHVKYATADLNSAA